MLYLSSLAISWAQCHSKEMVNEKNEGLFIFKYDTDYLNKPNSLPVSLTLPLRLKAYEQKTMFAFFDGLIPEGWLLNIIVLSTCIP
jgi:serine/threonine-protein kinase HipA